MDMLTSTVAGKVAELIRGRKGERIAVFEATSGGLVSAAMLAQPGASSWFISGAVIYTGRGAKRLLPSRVLALSNMMDRENNYKNAENYVESKLKYAEVLARENKVEFKADWCVVESGTTGPEFYVPGVYAGFTAVAVCSPSGRITVRLYQCTANQTRADNMISFANFTLQVLLEALQAENAIDVSMRTSKL